MTRGVYVVGMATSSSPNAPLARSGALAPDERPRLLATVPFAVMHLMPLGILWTGITLRDALLCAALYVARMFFVTAGYHRYFSHRAFKLSRFWQFVFAVGATSTAQKGVLWWAAHHRHHHKHSDQPEDVHSPRRGFWWSHVGWILAPKNDETAWERVQDLAKYPELRWLDRFHLAPAIALGVAIYFLFGASGLFVGFFLSTVLVWHGTFLINSVTHLYGRRRFVTTDTSRNSLLLALVTMGEGWHNNHHHYPAAARQGFFWWELDITYYGLKVMSWLGIIHDLKPVPEHVRLNHQSSSQAT